MLQNINIFICLNQSCFMVISDADRKRQAELRKNRIPQGPTYQDKGFERTNNKQTSLLTPKLTKKTTSEAVKSNPKTASEVPKKTLFNSVQDYVKQAENIYYDIDDTYFKGLLPFGIYPSESKANTLNRKTEAQKIITINEQAITNEKFQRALNEQNAKIETDLINQNWLERVFGIGLSETEKSLASYQEANAFLKLQNEQLTEIAKQNLRGETIIKENPTVIETIKEINQDNNVNMLEKAFPYLAVIGGVIVAVMLFKK